MQRSPALPHSRNASLFALATALLLSFLASPSTAAEDQQPPPDAKTTPQQWRCIWTKSPSTNALIAWNTRAKGKSHRVLYRESVEGKPSPYLETQAKRNAAYSASKPKLFYHHAHLSDLQPDTTYEVLMESDGHRSPTFRLTTAPDQDQPLTILFGADSRSGHKERRLVNAMLSRMTQESREEGKTPIVAFAHGGDYVYSGNDLGQWSRWMSDYELTTNADGHLLPIIPARGNHDGGPIFNEVFGFPKGHRNYYAIDIGPHIRWITLNSETSVAGDQSTWLSQELAGARPKYRWIVPQYHRPAFPAVKNVPGRSLVHWVPLFEKHHVDLVCEGDGHSIKRTTPIRNNMVDTTGVVYIGEGGLGVGQREPKLDRWYLNSKHAKAGMGHHIQMLSFDHESLLYRVVLLDAKEGSNVFDEHRFSPRSPELRGVKTKPTPGKQAG